MRTEGNNTHTHTHNKPHTQTHIYTNTPTRYTCCAPFCARYANSVSARSRPENPPTCDRVRLITAIIGASTHTHTPTQTRAQFDRVFVRVREARKMKSYTRLRARLAAKNSVTVRIIHRLCVWCSAERYRDRNQTKSIYNLSLSLSRAYFSFIINSHTNLARCQVNGCKFLVCLICKLRVSFPSLNVVTSRMNYTGNIP